MQNKRIGIMKYMYNCTILYYIVQWLHRKNSTTNIRVTNAWKDAMSVTDLRVVWPNSCGLKGKLLETRRNVICVPYQL